MRRHLLIYGGIALVALVVGGFAVTAGDASQSSASTASPLSKMTNHGTAVQLSDPARELVERVRRSGGPVIKAPSLMGIRGGRAFYSLASDARHCFAGGSATVDGPQIDSIACSDSFPSKSQPVLNLSIVEVTAARPTSRFINLRGIAADGVARVAALNQQGDVVAEVQVVRNVFAVPELPEGADATGVVAFDRAGTIVYRVSAVG